MFTLFVSVVCLVFVELYQPRFGDAVGIQTLRDSHKGRQQMEGKLANGKSIETCLPSSERQ